MTCFFNSGAMLLTTSVHQSVSLIANLPLWILASKGTVFEGVVKGWKIAEKLPQDFEIKEPYSLNLTTWYNK